MTLLKFGLLLRALALRRSFGFFMCSMKLNEINYLWFCSYFVCTDIRTTVIDCSTWCRLLLSFILGYVLLKRKHGWYTLSCGNVILRHRNVGMLIGPYTACCFMLFYTYSTFKQQSLFTCHLGILLVCFL